METLKTYAIVPTLVVIFLSFLIINHEWDTYEISLKIDVLLFQTCYHVVAQILAELFEVKDIKFWHYTLINIFLNNPHPPQCEKPFFKVTRQSG
jgi:hypothetical protein